MDLDTHIQNRDQLTKQANGGNSIIFSYPPKDENLYLEEAKNRYKNTAYFIDISKLLVRLIDSNNGWDSFENYYKDFESTPHIIFKSDDPATDLFDLIINEIKLSATNNKIPILIRTGCLYGTGIENINITENKMIMKLPIPLVIFYPSKIEDENILFLNFKSASEYRCILVK